MVHAGGVEVAYASVVVPTYRLPPILEKSQCLRLAPAPESERTSCFPVVVAMVSAANGVVVPSPRFPAAPSHTNCWSPALPNRTVVDAWNPAVRSSGVPVEFVVAPKAVVLVNENAAPLPVASVPQTMLPDASVSNASLQEMREETVNPPEDTRSPRIVDVADPPVVSMDVADSPAANVDVAAVPCTTRKPVVVAPPEMVRPVVCVAPPIVDEA